MSVDNTFVDTDKDAIGALLEAGWHIPMTMAVAAQRLSELAGVTVEASSFYFGGGTTDRSQLLIVQADGDVENLAREVFNGFNCMKLPNGLPTRFIFKLSRRADDQTFRLPADPEVRYHRLHETHGRRRAARNAGRAEPA